MSTKILRQPQSLFDQNKQNKKRLIIIKIKLIIDTSKNHVEVTKMNGPGAYRINTRARTPTPNKNTTNT